MLLELSGTLLAACSDLTEPAAFTPTFDVTAGDLGTLAGNASAANSVNADTQVVGRSSVKKKGKWTTHAILWTPSTGMQDLTPQAEASSEAHAINASGTIAGEIVDSGVYRAFRRTTGGQLELLAGMPGYDPRGRALALNDVGQIVGYAWLDGPYHAALWETTGSITDLGVLATVPCTGGFPSCGTPTSVANDINEQGTVVGFVGRTGSSDKIAFRWTQGTGIQALSMPFGVYSAANAVNDDGTVAGFIEEVSGYRHAVIWTPGGAVIDLGSLGGSFNQAFAVNNSGVVVGESSLSSGELRAFIWDPANGTMLDLTSESSSAYDISDNGIAVGKNQAGHAGIWTGMPNSLIVNCSPTTLTRGTEITCTASASGGVLALTKWTFTPDPNSQLATLTDSTDNTVWPGMIVIGGTVRAYGTVGGVDTVSNPVAITVTPRNWIWDNSKRSFAQGVPPDLDNCVGTRTGLTADKFGCTSANPGLLINPGPNQGFVIAQGTGPNAGFWFVTNATTRMDLRTQLSKKYRSDDTTRTLNGVAEVLQACSAASSPNPVPPQNNLTINTVCFQVSGFTDLVDFTWNHEAQHLVLAQQEAEKPYNDIYADWEGIVLGDSVSTFLVANSIQNTMHGMVADTANKIHSGATTEFELWYHTGSGVWEWSTVITTH